MTGLTLLYVGVERRSAGPVTVRDAMHEVEVTRFIKSSEAISLVVEVVLMSS